MGAMDAEPVQGSTSRAVTRRILVQGRVQGVGYRYFVVLEAEALGVTGWVRNLLDGGVEVLACGRPDVVDALVGRLWAGPRLSRVTAVDVTDVEPYTGGGFRVLATAP